MPLIKIKLCIIIPTFKCGGSERFVSIFCNNINTNVFDVKLIILDGDDPFYKITNPAVDVIMLNIKNVRKSLFPVLASIKKNKPDILFSVSNHLNIFLCIFKFLFPKKMLLVARETSIVSINNKRSKYGKFYDRLVKTFYKNIDYIICQSAYMQHDLVKNYRINKEKTIIIYNPVEEFSQDILADGNKVSAVKKFFTVARLSPEKGIDRLLNALALLKIDFVFHVIGEGSEENDLKLLTKKLNLQSKVFFEGKKLLPYKNMNDADLLLIGSHYEGLPNVSLEAGMLGIPVVGYNCTGGIAEIVEESVNGFLVNNDQPAMPFVDAIMRAVNYNFNRSLIIEKTKNKFSINKIIPQLENFFLKILQTP